MNTKNITAEKILVTALLLGTLLILGAFFARLSFPHDYRVFERDDKDKLTPDKSIHQPFTAIRNNLDQVNIMFDNYPPPAGEKVSVLIRNETCRELLRTGTVILPHASPKTYEEFKFKPIPDSKGKNYCLDIHYEAKKERKNRPAVYVFESEIETDTYITTKSNKPHPGETIVFRPAYSEGSLGDNLGELNRRISAYKPGFLNGNVLYWLFGGYIILSAGLVVFLLQSRKNIQIPQNAQNTKRTGTGRFKKS